MMSADLSIVPICGCDTVTNNNTAVAIIEDDVNDPVIIRRDLDFIRLKYNTMFAENRMVVQQVRSEAEENAKLHNQLQSLTTIVEELEKKTQLQLILLLRLLPLLSNDTQKEEAGSEDHHHDREDDDEVKEETAVCE
jgi:hypothetical protein